MASVFVLIFVALMLLAIVDKYYNTKLVATYQIPLANVIIAKQSVKYIQTEDAYSKSYQFSDKYDFFTKNIPVLKKLYEPYKDKPLHYLEIGVFEGRSLIWMLENVLTDPNSKATAIDIFYGDYEKTYCSNLELSGSAGKVTTIKDYSQLAMRKLPFESFDIIYIDGSHLKNDVLEDAVLAWRLVKKGGLIIFDDYRYSLRIPVGNINRDEFCKPAIDAFAQCFDKQFEVIHNDYQLILRRIK